MMGTRWKERRREGREKREEGWCRMERDLTQEVTRMITKMGWGLAVCCSRLAAALVTGCISSQPAFSDLGWKLAEVRIFTPRKSASITNQGNTQYSSAWRQLTILSISLLGDLNMYLEHTNIKLHTIVKVLTWQDSFYPVIKTFL